MTAMNAEMDRDQDLKKLVVRREAAFEDSMVILNAATRVFKISPYFCSESGTKRVEGQLVEAGEGQGPRKEFFIAISDNARDMWRTVAVSSIASTAAASGAAPCKSEGEFIVLQPPEEGKIQQHQGREGTPPADSGEDGGEGGGPDGGAMEGGDLEDLLTEAEGLDGAVGGGEEDKLGLAPDDSADSMDDLLASLESPREDKPKARQQRTPEPKQRQAASPSLMSQTAPAATGGASSPEKAADKSPTRRRSVSLFTSARERSARDLFASIQPGDRIDVVDPSDATTITSVLVKERVDGEKVKVDRTAFDKRGTSGSPLSYEGCGFHIWRAQEPLFEYVRTTGMYNFGSKTREANLSRPDLIKRFRHFGRLLAFAVFNHCKLGFLLPPMFFELLLRPQRVDALGINDIEDPGVKQGLQKVLKMSKANFSMLLELDGDDKNLSKEEYVKRQVKDLLAPSAMSYVRDGWDQMTNPAWWRNISGFDLRAMLCNTHDEQGDFDVRDFFEIVMDDEMLNCKPLVKAFWDVVSQFSPEQKRQFLFFVTGVRTLPEKHTEQMRVELPFLAIGNEHHSVMSMLPQAHTCTNTIEIPNYYDSKCAVDGRKCSASELCSLIEEKILLAISETQGYELDAIEGAEEDEDDEEERAEREEAEREAAKQDAEDRAAAAKLLANTGSLDDRRSDAKDDGPSLIDVPDIDWSFSKPVEKAASTSTSAPKKPSHGFGHHEPVVLSDAMAEDMGDIDSMLLELDDL